jgi:hypothetical protein
MQKWQYLQLNISGDHWSLSDGRNGTTEWIKGIGDSFHKILNTLGSEGWELVADVGYDHQMILKRPLQSDD